MKSKLVSIVAGTALILAACSSAKLADLSTKTNLQKKAKYDFNRNKIKESGRGFAIDMKKLGKMPQRVALVSFYLDDPGITKVTGTNATGKNFNTTNTGSAQGSVYANSFYNAGLDTLRNVFKKYDMELLTPDQFLTDDDKKDFYNEFVVKHTTTSKMMDGLKKWAKNAGNYGTTLELDQPADGFALVKVNKRDFGDEKKKTVELNNLNGTNDAQMIESVGYDLCKNLGVDAVVIVYNSHLAGNKWGKPRFYLSAVNMQMFGPNPLQLQEGKKDNMFYSKGLFYCGLRMRFKEGLLINPKVSKKATDEEKSALEKATYQGYKNALASTADKMGNYLKTELNGK